MNASDIVKKLLEDGADDVDPKEYLASVPVLREENWCFSHGELAFPEQCKRTDEMVASVTPEEGEDEEQVDEEGRMVHVIVYRNGAATKRYAYSPEFQGPVEYGPEGPWPEVPRDIWKRAEDQSVLFNPKTNELADFWRMVVSDEHGNFVKWRG